MTRLLLALLLGLLSSLAPALVPSAQAQALPPWTTPAVASPLVEYRQFASTLAGGPVSYHVYLPAAYAAQPWRRFPVVYWLHGSGTPTEGIATVAARFHQAIAEERIPPLIVVFPNGLPYGMWCDAKSGVQPVESVFVHDLIPQVDGAFRTIPERRGRVLDGFSMGGYGAARLGLRFQGAFAGFSMLGAGPLQLDLLEERPGLQPIELRRRILDDVYGGDPAFFAAQSPSSLAETFLASAQRHPPRIRQVIGTLDFTLQGNRDFHARLTQLGIAHEYIEVPGVGHVVPGLMDALGDRFWAFYRESFRLLDPQGFAGQDYSGTWYAPANSGWGLAIQSYGDQVLVLGFVYEGAQPTWFVLQERWSAPDVLQGAAWRRTNPGAWGTPQFTPADQRDAVIGTLRLEFTGRTTLELSGSVGDRPVRASLVRLE
ncbi:MAG: alpha/beta hydrolase [Lysobacteraceae bacterium]